MWFCKCTMKTFITYTHRDNYGLKHLVRTTRMQIYSHASFFGLIRKSTHATFRGSITIAENRNWTATQNGHIYYLLLAFVRFFLCSIFQSWINTYGTTSARIGIYSWHVRDFSKTEKQYDKKFLSYHRCKTRRHIESDLKICGYLCNYSEGSFCHLLLKQKDFTDIDYKPLIWSNPIYFV